MFATTFRCWRWHFLGSGDRIVCDWHNHYRHIQWRNYYHTKRNGLIIHPITKENCVTILWFFWIGYLQRQHVPNKLWNKKTMNAQFKKTNAFLENESVGSALYSPNHDFHCLRGKEYASGYSNVSSQVQKMRKGIWLQMAPRRFCDFDSFMEQ